MADIFQKVVSDNCLVLYPREALLYPFNLGNWKEIRVGLFMSAAGNSGDNSPQVSETVTQNSTIKNRFFFGLKNSSNNLLPLNTGVVFMGITTPNSKNCFIGNLQGVQWGIATPDNPPVGALVSSSGTNTNTYLSSADYSAALSLLMPDIPTATGNSSYAYLNGLRFLIDGNNLFSGYVFKGNSSYSDISVGNLRAQISSMPNLSSVVTGNFTVDGTSGTAGLTKPDALFLYFPFFTNQIRIHTLVIEVYQ